MHIVDLSANTISSYPPMKLSPAQAATRLGKSRRQIMYMIKQERLQAEKIGGRWFVDETNLSLNKSQQRVHDRKQHQLRAAVEEALELDDDSKRRYSLRDLKAFQIALPIYRRLVEKLGEDHSAAGHLRHALEQLSLGCHRFDHKDKISAYRAARDAASFAICELMLTEHQESDPLIDAIEQNFMTTLSGLLRRLDTKHRR
jgi:hypothetical protein